MVKNQKRKSDLKLCDKIRSNLVKLKAWCKCEHCWKTEKLNSHHIFSRINYSTRFDLENGVCLCVWCHTMSSKFSAHRTPMEFADRIKEYRWEERYNNLKLKKNQKRDKDYDKVKQYLLDKTNELTQ